MSNSTEELLAIITLYDANIPCSFIIILCDEKT